MPHTDTFYHWNHRVQALFPALRPHHRSALAEYSFGIALAGACGLTTVAAYLGTALGVPVHALTQRLREFYCPAAAQRGAARTAFDHTLCFGPLVRWAASGHPNRRLVIALDPTLLRDRLRVLCAAVVYHGTALPVAWAVQTGPEKGSWNDLWVTLLGRLRRELGGDWTVLVLTDRGLESPTLFRAITALGWHPLMRVKAAGHFRPAGWHKGYAMGRFAPSVGRRWTGTGTAYPTGAAVTGTLLAAWNDGHAEPWLILTDLAPNATNPAWYAWRMGIEHGFRAVKRGQLDWHRTRTADPDRVARQWAALAVATIWLIEIGGQGEAADVPNVPGPPRRISLLKVGILVLRVAVGQNQPVPEVPLRAADLVPPRWDSDPLTEAMMNEC